MKRRHVLKAKRIVATTLAVLLAMYSLPPTPPKAPIVSQVAINAPADDGVLLRNALYHMNLASLTSGLGDETWHIGHDLETAWGQFTSACVGVPSAFANIAYYQYTHLIPCTSNGQPQVNVYQANFNPVHTAFFTPPGVPNISSGTYQYYVPGFLGFGQTQTTGFAPDQNSPNTLTLPVLDRNQENPRTVDFYNSYFSEHPGSTGYGLYLAYFYNDFNIPKALVENPSTHGAQYIEQSGTNLNGYLDQWDDWYSGTPYTGSGWGNYGEPKWDDGGINFTLKEHPWARINGTDWAKIQESFPSTAAAEEHSLYYWETNPHILALVNQELASADPDLKFTYGPKPTLPLKGFWVQVQPEPDHVWSSISVTDFPTQDGSFGLQVTDPYTDLKNNMRFAKLMFYRPWVRWQQDGQYHGFLNSGDAADNQGQHDANADFVCVGAFTSYPIDEPDVALKIYQEYNDNLPSPTPAPPGSSPTPTPNPGGGVSGLSKDQLAVYNSLPSDEQQQLLIGLQNDPDQAYAFLNLAAPIAKKHGDISGIVNEYEYQISMRLTHPGSEANESHSQPRIFATHYAGDPVDVTNGAQYYDFYDLKVPGRGMRTDFLRTYNSDFVNNFSTRNLMPTGYGWTNTYNQFLYRFPDDAVAYYDEHGKVTIFKDNNGVFTGPAGTPYTLTRGGDGSYTLHDTNGTVWQFSAGLLKIALKKELFYPPDIQPYGTLQPVNAGRLTSVTDRNGNSISLSYSSDGNLTTVTDAGGRQLHFAYQNGRISQMTDMAGRTFSYFYDGSGNLVKVIHPGNRTQVYTYSGNLMTSHSDLDASRAWNFTYDGSQRVSQVSDPDGNKTTYTYSGSQTVETRHEVDGHVYTTTYVISSNHDIAQRTDPIGTVHTFTYNDHYPTSETYNRGDATVTRKFDYDRGALLSYTDPSGQTTSIQYGPNAQPKEVTNPAGNTLIRLDAKGNMLGVTDPAGRTVGFSVDSNGQVQGVTDAGGHRTGLDHDSNGLLEHVDNPLGGWTTFSYNALGQIVSATDPTGTRRYSYDDKGYLRSYTDQLGRETDFETDANGNITKVTAPGGRVTEPTYDKKNELVQVVDNAGDTTRYAYTANGQLYKVTDPNGHTTTYERDGNGRVIKIDEPNEQAKRFEYDASGNVTAVHNELDQITRYAYDSLDRVTTVTDPAGNATRLVYAWIGAVTRMTDAKGHVTQYGVNAVGQVTSVTPPAPAGSTQYVYNADGTLAKVVKPEGQTLTYTYNAANQVASVTDTRKTVNFAYDDLGRLTGITAPEGRQVSFSRDALGRLLSVTDALGNPTEYDYWTTGELKSVRKVNGAVTQYDYDAVGRLSEVLAAENRTTLFKYDRAGNLIEKTSPLGGITDYTYDPLNRLVELDDLARGARSSYAYDAAGRLTESTDPNGQTTRVEYDRLGRPVLVTDALGGNSNYEYDQLGNLLKRTDANGHTTEYGYNADNWLTSVTDALGHQTDFAYDPLGNLTRIERLADGATTDIAYNDLNLPSEVRNALSYATQIQYDDFGNRTAVTDAKGRTTRYAYDQLNRLTSVDQPLGRTTRYAYDRVGDLSQVTNALGISTRKVYDLADRLRYLYEPLGRTTEFQYNAQDELTLVRDANGNQNTVDYDKAGRAIREMNGLGYSTNYFYDRLDNLTRKSDALGHSTQYAYDSLSRLVGVTDALGDQTRYDYDPVGNLTRYQDARGKAWNFEYDAMDRVALEHDPLGRSTARSYDAVGNLAELHEANGNLTTYSYDRLDRLTGVRTADDFEQFAYDEVGNLTSYQNKANHTENSYDDLNQLTQEENLTWNKTTRYGYDVLGRMTSLTTPMGRTVRYAYDDLNQLSGVTDPEGNRTGYEYDIGGRLTNTLFPTGNREERQYDQADQVTSLLNVGHDGRVQQGFYYNYDQVGNRTQVQETDGALTQFTYDPLNRLIQANYPLATILADRRMNLASEGSHQDAGSYNVAAAPSAPTSAVAVSATPVHGNSGHYHVLDVTSVDGTLSTSGTAGGTSTPATIADSGSVATSGSSAVGGSANSVGGGANDVGTTGSSGLTSTSSNGKSAGNNGNNSSGDSSATGNGGASGTGDTTGTDTTGNASSTTETGSAGSSGLTGNGNGSQGNSGGQNSGNGGQGSGLNSQGNGYAGDPSKDKNPDANGNGWAKGHDKGGSSGNSSSSSSSSSSGASYGGSEFTATPAPTPAPKQRPVVAAPPATAVLAPPPAAPSQTKTPPGKVKNGGGPAVPYWSQPVAQVNYTYDQVGNRLTEQSSLGMTSCSYDDANELKQKVMNPSRPPRKTDVTTYEYDGNGNRTSKTTNKAGESAVLATTQYQYDGFNRLSGIRYADGSQASYGYDPMGRMISSDRPHLPGEKPVQAERSEFTYAGRTLLDEWHDGGLPRAEYYSGNGQLISKRLFDNNGHFEPYGVISPSEDYLYYQHDALGSVAGLTDHFGTQVMRYREDAFGNPLAGILEPYNQQLLTEKPFDTESDLYYFGSRWYDASNGQFMNQDSYRGSISAPMSLHRYAYVDDNPVNMVDVWGHQAQWQPQSEQSFLGNVLGGIGTGFSAVGDFAGRVSDDLVREISNSPIGGAARVVGSAIGTAVNYAEANPLQAGLIAGATVAAGVAIAFTAPVAIPALLSIASNPFIDGAVTSIVEGEGASIATEIATSTLSDVAYSYNPMLGKGADALGTLAGFAVNFIGPTGGGLMNSIRGLSGVNSLSSLVSPSTLGQLSDVAGTLSGATAAIRHVSDELIGQDVPGLAQAQGALSVASLATGALGAFASIDALNPVGSGFKQGSGAAGLIAANGPDDSGLPGSTDSYAQIVKTGKTLSNVLQGVGDASMAAAVVSASIGLEPAAVLGAGFGYASMLAGNAVRGAITIGEVTEEAAAAKAAGNAESLGQSALKEASQDAYKAADDAGSFNVSNKHLAGANGNYAKFSTNDQSQVQTWIKEALESPTATFNPNAREDSFTVITDLGKRIGTKGQTRIKVIVGKDGKIWTAYPVN